MITQLEQELSAALRRAIGPDADGLSEQVFRWEMPKELAFGDVANSMPFKLAGRRKQPPAAVAQELAARLFEACRGSAIGPWVDRVEPKAGFLNVFLSTKALEALLRDILRQRGQFGARPQDARLTANVEFVSANPTGPLSLAHGRQAAVGDALVRLLRSQGITTTAEYYLNDEGRQIEMLGRSVRARYAELVGSPEPFPEDGYHGAYVHAIAKRCLERHGGGLLATPPEEARALFIREGMAQQLEEIKQDLQRFGLTFDAWTSQAWLRTSGRIDQALEALKKGGALFEGDGAVWFASTKYGDDKDRVVRKKDGELTYLAPDIAYHRWKFEQGYGQVINLWGPDHHGYIARIKASVQALGLPVDRLTVRIVQLVTLLRQGKPVPMSKRQGEFVTFREVMDEVGVDATRFFLLMRTTDSQLEFDLDLAKSKSQDNPVYYVQYAHARICSIFAKAKEEGCAVPDWEAVDLARLREPEEQQLQRTLLQYPIVLRLCAAALEPHGVTGYLRRLAESFHVFYAKCRVVTEDPGLTAARLALVEGARQVLANGLGVLGVSAPTRM